MSPLPLCHTWLAEVAQLRARAARVRRQSLPRDALEVLDDALGTCESLLFELEDSHRRGAHARQESSARASNWEYLYASMPVACLELDGSGSILRANRFAGLLLNTSTRHLVNRLLMHYAEDRQEFSALLRRLSSERAEIRLSLVMRPRERAPVPVDVTAIPHDPLAATTSLWFLVPIEGKRCPRVRATPCGAVPELPNEPPTPAATCTIPSDR